MTVDPDMRSIWFLRAYFVLSNAWRCNSLHTLLAFSSSVQIFTVLIRGLCRFFQGDRACVRTADAAQLNPWPGAVRAAWCSHAEGNMTQISTSRDWRYLPPRLILDRNLSSPVRCSSSHCSTSHTSSFLHKSSSVCKPASVISVSSNKTKKKKEYFKERKEENGHKSNSTSDDLTRVLVTHNYIWAENIFAVAFHNLRVTIQVIFWRIISKGVM